MISLVVFPVQLKYKWNIKNPKSGIARIPTTIEQMMIMTVGLISVSVFERAKMITLRKKVPMVSITDAKNMTKNR